MSKTDMWQLPCNWMQACFHILLYPLWPMSYKLLAISLVSAMTPRPSSSCWDEFPYPANLHYALWSSVHDLPFSCIQMYSAYPTQSACLGSTWLYLYFALLSIWGYFLPSVLLTGSVIEYKKSISYSV